MKININALSVAAHIIMTLWERFHTWRKTPDEHDLSRLAADVDAVYAVAKLSIHDVGPLVQEWQSGGRSLQEILLPLRAAVNVIADRVGDIRPSIDTVDERELLVAAVLARLLHETTGDDDVIPLVDDIEAIRWMIRGAASSMFWPPIN